MSKNTGTSELINYFDLGANGDVGIAGSLDVNTIANATTDTDKFLVSDTGIIKYRTGAELLTDIGAQGLLTNPITGTGTSGTIPVFTGSTTLGNSIIQSNSTQVNIVGNGSQLLFDSLGSTKDGGIQYVNDFTLQMYNSRGAGSSIYLGNNNLDLNINPSTNPRLRITSGGNVLINPTTDNGARLQVNGTMTANTTTITNGTRSWVISPSGASIQEEFSGVIEGKIDPSSGGNSWLGATSGTTGAGAKHYFSSTGAAIFASSVTAASLALSGTIASGGDTATLTIKQAGTTFTNGIYLERAGERNGYYMYIGGALDSLTFRTNYFGTQSDVLSLTRDGNVGIGIGTPTFYGSSYRTLEFNAPSFPVFNMSSAGIRQLSIISSSTESLLGTFSNTPLRFYTNSSPKMTITSSGNVLIGTTSDNGALLQVQGAIDGSTFSSTAGALTIDANTQFKSGFYRWNDTSTNLPEAGFFAVVIYGNCGNVVAQMATHFTNANTYVRSYNSSWTAWRRII